MSRPIRKILGKRGVKWVTEDGYIYIFKRANKNSLYVRCANKLCSGSCRVVMHGNSDDGEAVLVHEHTFGNSCKSGTFVGVEKLRSTILKRAERENTPNSVIFTQEINRAPFGIRNQINFKDIERSMQRAHKKSNPGAARTFEEFANLIESWPEKYGNVNNEQFFVGRFGSGNEECLLAVVTPLTQTSLRRSKEWHLDGTFKCRPKQPASAQLFVIMATEYDRAFPVAWVLMKSRTTKAYDVVFDELKNQIPDMDPEVIMSDYEKALRASVRKAFPETKHVGCWFHFSQAIERNAKKLGIKFGSNDGWIVAKRLMATALVPIDKIDEAVASVKSFAQTSRCQAKSERLIAYFKKEWMEKVKPVSFSVHGQARRTNNCQEALNRTINRHITSGGNTWDFWGGLISISVKEINNFCQISEGNPGTRDKRNKWLLQDKLIKRLQTRLAEGTMSIESFLSAASHRFRCQTPEATTPTNEHEDVEDDDAELDTLDNLVQQEQPMREDVDEDDELEVPRIPSTEHYRLEPVRFAANSIADVPERQFVLAQINRLKNELSSGEDLIAVIEGDGGVVCTFCTVNKATRLFVPCGHWAGCYMCTAQLVNTPMYFVTINYDGDLNEVEDYQLPLRCPQCQCLVGSCMRVYGIV